MTLKYSVSKSKQHNFGRQD